MEIETLKNLKRDKKGELGLSLVKTVMVFFLVLAVLAIAIVLALSSLKDPVEDIDKTTVSVYNETLSDIGGAGGEDLTYASSDTYRKAVCTISYVQNESDGVALVSANYTESNSGCTITSATAAEYNGSSNGVNVTYSVTYSNPESNLIIQNMSSALTDDFFDQTGTIFAILIVVAIMMAIGLIIYVVTRFSTTAGISNSGTGGGLGGASKSFGSDTVMGI